MSYGQNLWLFFVLLLGIIIVPGMDMLFVLANALASGRRAGLSATAGVMLGGAVHTMFGVFGVGALLHWAPSLFTLVLCVGAAYMAWIGWTLARSSIVVEAVQTVERRSLGTIFRQGATTCLLNPKAYFFVVSVYPQFVGPQYGALWPQALVLGAMTLLTQFGVYGGLAAAAGRGRDLLIGNPQATALVGRLAGLLLMSVAGLAAWRACTA